VWFSASTRRWHVLQTNIHKNACSMKNVSNTRWLARADAVFALNKSYTNIKKALTQVGEDHEQKPIVRAEVKALAKKLDSYDIALMSVMWNKLLPRMNSTGKSLQKPRLVFLYKRSTSRTFQKICCRSKK